MLEFLILGGALAAAYLVFRSDDESKPKQIPDSVPLDTGKPGADETARFEEHLAALMDDPAVLDATLRFVGMPAGSVSETERREMTAESKKSALAAWSSSDPQEAADAAFRMRMALPRIDISDASRSHLRALTEAYRERIEKLSGQGKTVDAMFNKLDSAPKVATMSMEFLAEPGVVAASEEMRSIDLAARSPYFGLFGSESLHTADIEGKNGVMHPVYKGVSLVRSSDMKGLEVPATVRLERFVKKTTSDSGVPANVYVATVTSAVPDEARDARLFVFTPLDVTFGVPAV